MDKNRIIEQFAQRHAPASSGANNFARHTVGTLATYLNVEPDEVVAFCEAGLLQAEEAWPGAPSLRFSTLHLSTLRHELARQHAADAVELCEGRSERELARVIELSWQKRRDRVVELSQKT